MSPTVFMWKEYRFFFFSREERRAHVHIQGPDGEAKLWLEPEVDVARNHGLSEMRLREVLRVVKERRDELVTRWRDHFPG